MSEVERRFHEQWLGMAQPAEGLVVSLPVLIDAQCMEKLPREAHVRFLAELAQDKGRQRIQNLSGVLEHVLELGPERFDEEGGIPQEMSLFVPEGKQLLRPTRALKWASPPEAVPGADATPAAIAARPYALLVWEVPPAVESLDKPETVTGAWEYPAQAKMERLMRECRVPIGLLSNGWELRLVYAPHGESSGWVAFRVEDMASVSGRPIFDAFVMLLGRQRWFGVAPERQLPALLAESRKRNVDVTNELSHQVFEALEVLLAGFSAADERDGTGLLRQALDREDEHLYAGLLAVLLRMVFLLYCEDRALLPVEKELFAENYSLLGLFNQLQEDNGKYPDTMHRRFGAYPQLISLFRAVFLGVKHGDLDIPARRGELFDPNTYPFLEGWGPEGSAPVAEPEERAQVRVPSVDDLTIFTALHKLLYLGGQRLSYKALDVEQIGSVYEALMGFNVQRLSSAAVRIKLGSKKGSARVWVEVDALLAVPKAQRARWLQDELGFDKGVAEKIVQAVKSTKSAAVLAELEPVSGRRPECAAAGSLVVQPGPERRRTSSHYTPRELTEPIVARTLDPLIKTIGDAPASEALLSLVICDPAMGSGAFLVAACRYLADHVVAAWTREGKLEVVADAHDDVVNLSPWRKAWSTKVKGSLLRLLDNVAVCSETLLPGFVHVAGELLGGELERDTAPRTTFRQLGKQWTDGKLRELHPDHVKAKDSSVDGLRLSKLYEIDVGGIKLGDIPLDQFALDHAERAMQQLPESAKRPGTRRHYAQLINRVLALAVYPCRIIERNPLPKGFMPKVGRPPAYAYLYPAEEAKLMGCAGVPLAYRILFGFPLARGLPGERGDGAVLAGARFGARSDYPR